MVVKCTTIITRRTSTVIFMYRVYGKIMMIIIVIMYACTRSRTFIICCPNTLAKARKMGLRDRDNPSLVLRVQIRPSWANQFNSYRHTEIINLITFLLLLFVYWSILFRAGKKDKWAKKKVIGHKNIFVQYY